MSSAHTVVLASAGTGKTHLLTSRYIRLLALGEDPASVLATTFARKAAGEILDRVLGRISAAAVSDDDAEKLSKDIGHKISRARANDLLARVTAEFGRLGVGTIDALQLRMASVFALELGVPPGWSIVDDERDADLRYEAVERAIDAGDEDEFYSLIRLLHGGESGRGVHDAVLRAVDTAHKAYVASAEHPEAWERIGPESTPMSEGDVAEAVDLLAQQPVPTTKGGTPNKNWDKALRRVVEAARGADWDGFLEDSLLERYPDQQFSRAQFPAGVAGALGPLIRHASAVLFGRIRGHNIAVRELLRRFDVEYSAIKRETASYRFEDLPRLLRSRPFAGELDHLYYMLDARYRHALLDEFQDTSIDQFALLEPLLDELIQSDDGRSVLFVGDVKQSLYQWRSAEPELMPRLTDRWAVLDEQTLSVSYRSSSTVLDTVNRVFARPDLLEPLEGLESARKWGESFVTHEAAREMPGLVTLTVAEAGDDEKKREAVERTVADRVQEICKESRNATVGVLVRANSRIAPLIHLLIDRDIDASEEGGNPLSDAPAVAVAASLLHLGDHPGDTACRYHVSTSPLGEVVGLASHDDDRAASGVAAKIRSRCADRGCAHTLAWLYEKACADMTDRERSRFEQLIELAESFDGSGATRPSELARIIRSRGVVDPSSTRVRVMTVHRSKGLEFDAVVLGDLDASWEPKGGDVIVHRDEVLGPPTVVTMHVGKGLRRFNAEAERVFEAARDRAIGGELCVLYVAMTRAARRLDMVVAPPGKQDEALSASRVLRLALAPDGPETGELFSDSAGDWRDGLRPAAPSPKTERIGLALGDAGRAARLRAPVHSPSSFEGGGMVDVARMFEPKQQAATIGTLVHAMFEQIEWLDDGTPDRSTLVSVARELCGDEKLIEHAVECFQNALGHASVDALLRRARYDGWGELRVENERAFSVLVEGEKSPSLLRGRIDRLVRCATRVEIIDFKTDAIGSQEVEASVEFYRPQVAAYADAAQQMFGLGRRAITTTLVFVTPGVVVEVA